MNKQNKKYGTGVSDTSDDEQQNKLEKKKVNFTEDTVDNTNDEPPRKKNKKLKQNDVVIQTREPTEAELIECNKPENKKDIVSKRKQKKQKHDELVAKQKLESVINARQKNLNYLSLWKHNRTEWKFNKIQQLWLQKHMFDQDMIPNDNFDTLIEYFSGAKGQIRQTIIKDCMEIIEKQEKDENDEVSDNDKIKFSRARNMIQCLEE